MSKQGFYNDNMFRAYPFVYPDEGVGLPKSTIVDFGCYTCSNVDYIEGQNSVWLKSVSRSGDEFTFTFECDADGLSGRYLIFTRNLNQQEFSYSFSDVVIEEDVGSDSLDGGGCYEKSLWEGYLVTGSLEDLSGILDSGDTIDGITVVEPSLVVNVQAGGVRAINVANRLPITVTPAEDCGVAEEEEPQIYLYKACLTGDITFSHGYSCNAGITPANNEISFTATVTESVKGQFCGNEGDTNIYLKSNLVPGMMVSPYQVVPEDSALYTGGPLCSETLKSINGIGGKRLWIVGGKGIELTTNGETNTIQVEATLSGLAICADVGLSLSSASEPIP